MLYALRLWIMLFAIVITAIVVSSLVPVMAAEPLAPACLPINTAGSIVVYRCEPDEGMPFLLNSMGFMVQEK